MEILFKVIDGVAFKQTIPEDTTIKELKIIVQELNNYNNDISFIFQGQILQDDEIIKNLKNLKESFIIIHFIKPKEIRFLPTSPIYQIPEPFNFPELVNNIVEMGFSKPIVENLLRINLFNIESTVNQLLNSNDQILNNQFRFNEIINHEPNEIIDNDNDEQANLYSENNEEEEFRPIFLFNSPLYNPLIPIYSSSGYLTEIDEEEELIE